MPGYKRKTPEELLESIKKLQQGKLKILIGAVSGSGKTYHMLREGQLLRSQGIDVIICAVSTLQRSETIKQLGDLERVPSVHWHKGEQEMKDLNLPALLERNPEVVLVDGLAHRNRKGAEFPSRVDDIRYLLDKGISVITTLNVYELEGIDELAHKWTGIRPDHTIPVQTLSMAEEIRLIDVSPQTLLGRLQEGHLHNSRDTSLFTRKDLSVLRELSLRLMAEGVNTTLERYREEQGLEGPSGASERILVSAQYHWNGSIYIRRGQQIAKRLGGDLLVAVFMKKGMELNKEQQAFKRSMTKMVDKTEADFVEILVDSPRKIPSELACYAAEKKVTRIVLGHSKKTGWQELWQGSFVDKLLRLLKGTDVFLIADHAELEGQRILPTRRAEDQVKESYRRLSKQEVQDKAKQMKRGRFKIYIGAAPGVGKTYTMLREGNELVHKDFDVVVGYLETHGRQETADQVMDLPVVPRLVTEYRGVKLEEMNTDEIIRRNPEVVLVDELAHTNVPGSQRKKRYEDVQVLLDKGISVISTVNVQHLESLNDAVEQITGVKVRETVPDSILALADEVELIDVTPQSLQERMRAGKIYAAEKVEQALGSFFRIGNLIALRELALREIADDVDERLESWERSHSLRGPWRREEVIYVSILPGTGASANRLIRRGFRIAYRLKAAWFVSCYVLDGLDEESRACIEAARLLTERLGGTFETIQTDSWKELPKQMIEQANGRQATQLITVQPVNSGRKRKHRQAIKAMLQEARHLDVLLVSDTYKE